MDEQKIVALSQVMNIAVTAIFLKADIFSNVSVKRSVVVQIGRN